MDAPSYKPPHGGYPGADRYPGLAVEDGRAGELIERARDDAAQADALGYLLGELYPPGSVSS